MKLFIFNDSTGKQRADFYESELSEDVLWEGANWSEFEAETGLNIDQLGGFKKENGVLVFDQALKDAFDNPKPCFTLEQKRLQLIETYKTLPITTRLQFQQVALTVDISLKRGDVELALFNLEGAKAIAGANVPLIQSMIDLIKN